MIFKKALLLLTFLGVAIPMFSQGKYALSYSDFMNNKWTDINIVRVEERSNDSKVFSGGGDFKLIAETEEANELLKKEARFVIYDGALYVNCRSLRCEKMRFGNWYARGYRLDYENICFIGTTVSKEAQQKVATYGYAFGLIGSFIAANNQIKNRSCYILTSDSSTVYRVSSKYMGAFLRNSPQLRKEYTKVDKKKKESPEVVLEYFNKLQLLSNY